MSLERQKIFAAWAPAQSRWSAWAKPVLFANAEWSAAGENLVLPSAGLLPRIHDAALVIDLPGEESVLLGLALARAGFQPVPLYNGAADAAALVDMGKIARYLKAGAALLDANPVKADAAPAFLMNSDRMDNSVNATMPGRFDNRWCVVPQDMPSAALLKQAGIRKVVLVSDKVREDLAHVLYRYQEAELQVLRVADVDTNPSPVSVSKPGSFGSLWYRLGVFAGLRRNAAGGFGAITPSEYTGGGGGGWGSYG